MYEKYSQLRDERHLTDYKVSKATGISTVTLTNWKKGKYTPKLDKMKKLADFFGVSLEEFVA